jgi:Flp pilus assembly pilin Flp
MRDLIISIVVRAQNGVHRLRDDEQAQTLTEYALIIAVIAIGLIAALFFLRGQLVGFFSKAGSSAQNA